MPGPTQEPPASPASGASSMAVAYAALRRRCSSRGGNANINLGGIPRTKVDRDSDICSLPDSELSNDLMHEAPSTVSTYTVRMSLYESHLDAGRSARASLPSAVTRLNWCCSNPRRQRQASSADPRRSARAPASPTSPFIIASRMTVQGAEAPATPRHLGQPASSSSSRRSGGACPWGGVMDGYAPEAYPDLRGELMGLLSHPGGDPEGRPVPGFRDEQTSKHYHPHRASSGPPHNRS